ncbi:MULTISPECIES: hypothetical protein [Pseudomonas]|uniref:hypothetical protein n=2 Tax=Pseudomonas TaxID=286 RepID=UPI00240A1B61|nr:MULTISPECIES: hypothetical protein [Pseudomonas]MDT8924165.1 hypothetical protein [Pseudomonas taiwanensis]WEZ91174.1 hypothetical protein P3R38_16315 [Pseudomonas sp. NyZ480]
MESFPVLPNQGNQRFSLADNAMELLASDIYIPIRDMIVAKRQQLARQLVSLLTDLLQRTTEGPLQRQRRGLKGLLRTPARIESVQ